MPSTNPTKVLDQIDWYLANRNVEVCPGAFVLAGGNLARQIVEQVLFLLAFYGGVPRIDYLRPDGRLKLPSRILASLCSRRPQDRKTFLQAVRAKNPRLRRLARPERMFRKWLRVLNEPSHFVNPVLQRRTDEQRLRELVCELRSTLEPRDGQLTVAAISELRSRGRLRAVLSDDSDNRPVVAFDTVVRPRNLVVEGGNLTLRTPPFPIRIVSSTKDEALGRSRALVVVQDEDGPALQTRLVTEDGRPVNLTSIATMLASLASSPGSGRRVVLRLRRLGFRVQASEIGFRVAARGATKNA